MSFLLIAAVVIAQPPAAQPMSLAIEKLQAAVQYEVEAKQLPALSIAVVDGDKMIWAAGFGFEDAAKKKPATAETIYRVGSVSKLFTDVAIMQAVEQGKLDLDAPVQKYLPDFKPANSFDVPITLRQLMSHRSGLVRESPVGHYFDPTEPTLDVSVESLNKTSLVYKPGTKTKYSNAAIAVVGEALEKTYNASHPSRVTESILDPLQMSSSSFVLSPAIAPGLATGWMHTYDGRRFEAPKFQLGTGPAGNMYSTVTDLSKFLVCLLQDGQSAYGHVLKPESIKTMLTPAKDAEGKPLNFGLGFVVKDFEGTQKVGHGGAVYGFATQLEALPEKKLGVVSIASLDCANGVLTRLSEYGLRLMLAAKEGKSLPEYRRTTLLPPERVAELVGGYRDEKGTKFAHVTALGGRTWLQHGEYRNELRAAADNGAFLVDDIHGFGTELKVPESGKLTIGNETFLRLPDEPPADVPERWKGLVGEYGWDHDVLYILEDRGQLVALIEWFFYYPLKEVSENVFEFPPEAGLYHGEKIHFKRDAEGFATEALAAEVKFLRRPVGTKHGETFQIKPARPINEIRQIALAAKPPEEKGEFHKTELVEPAKLDEFIKLDIRYATKNNFAGSVFYQQPRAFLQKPAAEAVARLNKNLEARGLGLWIYDAYRPWHVTKMFWEATPEDLRAFVANPANGSRHNRGCAVDITLYDRQTGQPVPMVSGYDEFSPRAYPLYPGGTSRERYYRDLLRQNMEREAFTVFDIEWWHFDLNGWQKYRIGNATFEELDEAAKK